MCAATVGRDGTITVSALSEPQVLKVIGRESVRNGKSTLTPRQIDRFIKASRSQKPKL